MEIKSSSPEETKKIALKFAKKLTSGDTIALFGILGAGKTIFTQGIARGLGIRRKIVSPTFVFMRSYPLKIKGKRISFHHIDLYRGENTKDFAQLGLEEIFSTESIVVIEWADKIKSALPKSRYEIRIESINKGERKISIKKINK